MSGTNWGGSAGRPTVAQALVRALEEEILGGFIQPGSPLREEELAGRFHASRHVVREALRRLAADKLAEYVPFKGARVPRLTAEQVADIYTARAFIEGEAVGRHTITEQTQQLARLQNSFASAVKDEQWRQAFALDREFHCALVASIGSVRLCQFHREVLQSLVLAHLVAPKFQEEGFDRSVAEHGQIVCAIAAGDLAAAKQSLLSHLRSAESLLAADMGQ